MSFRKQWLKAGFSAFFIWVLFAGIVLTGAQDIVTSEDISGGSSVFVFRQSRKAPQSSASFRGSRINRSVSQRTAARNKLVTQANTVAKVQRTRTKQIDPNAVASNKGPIKNGKQTGPPIKTSTPAQTSILFAGAAETYLDKNDYDNAISYFKKAIELDPKNQNAKLGLSEAYTKKADDTFEKVSPGDSIPLYQEALKLNDKNAAAYAGLGTAYDFQNDDDNARTNFEKALALNPGLTELYAPLGIIYSQKGEIAQADTYLTKAAAKNPDDVDTNFYLGLIKFKQNHNDEAIAALDKSVKARPDSAEAHYYLGAAYARTNRVDESMSEYNRAVQIDRNYHDAWFDLGVANYNKGNYQEAANDYQEAVRIKNTDGQAFANLADVYRQMAGDSKNPKEKYDLYSKANSQYTIAANFIKDDPELYSNWGFCLARVAQWNNSIERLKTAVAMNPDAVDYTNLGWAYYNAAQVDSRVKKDPASAKAKLEEGKIALKKATELNPKFKAAFLNLGVTSTDLGDYQGAVTALKSAVALQDDWIPANNELGLAYRQLNDFENAVNQFKKVTKLNDNFVPGWYNLGEAEYRRGNIKEAKKAQEKLKSLKADNLARDLDLVIKGAVLTTNPVNQVKNKVQEKNPLNKIPKIPY